MRISEAPVTEARSSGSKAWTRGYGAAGVSSSHSRGQAGGVLLSPSLSRLGEKPPHGITSELLPAVSVSWAAR